MVTMQFVFNTGDPQKEIEVAQSQIREFERKVIVLKSYIQYMEDLQNPSTGLIVPEQKADQAQDIISDNDGQAE